MVASGTATLETALMQVPQVVIYRVGLFTALLFHLLVRLKHVSPVNIILNRAAVPELLQSKLTHQSLLEQVSDLLSPTQKRQAQMVACAEIKEKLLGEGAAQKVADIIEREWS
ncbi:MAG: hypothetical protein CMH56_13140 [Myxococcales bacterium]|nr:hypothetical protein [Myxococcales bacterium]